MGWSGQLTSFACASVVEAPNPKSTICVTVMMGTACRTVSEDSFLTASLVSNLISILFGLYTYVYVYGYVCDKVVVMMNVDDVADVTRVDLYFRGLEDCIC